MHFLRPCFVFHVYLYNSTFNNSVPSGRRFNVQRVEVFWRLCLYVIQYVEMEYAFLCSLSRE